MKKIYTEYKKSLKDIAIEEPIDLVLFRPLAFLIVKLIYPLPITPNQISLAAILTGIAAGVFFAFGDRQGFLIGGLLYALTHVLDCCDGMVARLKKNGTAIGRIVDGWSDYITSVAVYVGMLVGLELSPISLPVDSPWLLMVPAGLSLAVHCMMVDYYRREFLAHALGKANSIQQDLEDYSELYLELKQQKGKYLEKLLISFYIGYTKIQLKENGSKRSYPQEDYYRANKPLLMLWHWIGPATHIFILVLSAVLYEPMVFFFYVIILGNIWMLVLQFFQVKINNKIVFLEGKRSS